jgi:rhodanese-related sulfurtransferase
MPISDLKLHAWHAVCSLSRAFQYFAQTLSRHKGNFHMKTLLLSTLLIATAAFAQQPAFNAHVLSRAEVDALRAQPSKVLFIDVRRPDELTTKGGFPVYLSIQFSDLESNLLWIPKDRQIVTVSNHAARAGKAADLLAARGFKVAGAVGVELYEKDGGTLSKIVAPPVLQTQH